MELAFHKFNIDYILTCYENGEVNNLREILSRVNGLAPFEDQKNNVLAYLSAFERARHIFSDTDLERLVNLNFALSALYFKDIP
jgi:hypothetical protein